MNLLVGLATSDPAFDQSAALQVKQVPRAGNSTRAAALEVQIGDGDLLASCNGAHCRETDGSPIKALHRVEVPAVVDQGASRIQAHP